MGLLIAAVAPTQTVAGVMGSVLLYPLMFFAGLWTPRETTLDALLQRLQANALPAPSAETPG